LHITADPKTLCPTSAVNHSANVREDAVDDHATGPMPVGGHRAKQVVALALLHHITGATRPDEYKTAAIAVELLYIHHKS
jgi:hypothetical protein